MKIYTEINLNSFEFWGGAKFNADMLNADELNQLEYILEDIYYDGIDETKVNDIMWFDFEIVCEWLGLVYDAEHDVILRE